MKNKFTFFVMLVSLLTVQCKKEGSTTIDVSTITSTDFAGNLKSAEDKTDWTLDNNWSDREKALFETPPDSLLTNTHSSIVTVFPAYPNPTASVLGLAIKSSKKTLCEIVFTDKELTIKKRFFLSIKEGLNTNLFLMDEPTYPTNTNYRLYYGFYSSTDILYYKGHGDIQVVR